MTLAAVIILVLSALGFLAVVLSKLPVVFAVRPSSGRNRFIVAADSLIDYFLLKLKQFGRWLWHFILEAKDIRPSGKALAGSVEKVKKVFKVRIKQSEQDSDWMPEAQYSEVVTAEKAPKKTAEDLYLEAIKKDPENYGAYESLARLYLQNKNYEEAAETFKFLSLKQPGRDVYWSNLGISSYCLKNYQEAIGAYEQALKINSKVPARWINLALCFEALEQHDKAVKAINKALELAPRSVNYLMLLADIYIKLDNRVRGEEVLSQVLKLEPTNRIARERLMKMRVEG
ncbi:MAG: tetratricopeptide repeat protein [Acidobacteriaceae bacterium]